MDPYRLMKPLLFRLEPERAHRLAITALRLGLGPRDRAADPACLASDVLGLRFRNPIGLAAGFDKDAEAVRADLGLGFGFVEIGGVTPRAQPGNPRPRVFRVPGAEAMINRYGLNSAGAAVVAARLAKARAHGLAGPVGVNLGRNKDTDDPVADYVAGVGAFAGLADFLTLNVSSPNTPGLRDLQAHDALTTLLRTVVTARDRQPRRVPILVKIAPDLTPAEEEAIAAVALDGAVDGLIVCNTTVARPPEIPAPVAAEAGGLSGAPLRRRSTALIRRMAQLTRRRLPIVGVGGVASGADAYEKIRAGADLIQLYTALVYQGPRLVHRIKRELAAALAADGFTAVADAVGADVDAGVTKPQRAGRR